MTLDCTYAVPESHVLTIPLPQGFVSHKMVRILIEELDDSAKLELMREAANDPLYCSDMQEISDDWAIIGSEGL